MRNIAGILFCLVAVFGRCQQSLSLCSLQSFPNPGGTKSVGAFHLSGGPPTVGINFNQPVLKVAKSEWLNVGLGLVWQGYTAMKAADSYKVGLISYSLFIDYEKLLKRFNRGRNPCIDLYSTISAGPSMMQHLYTRHVNADSWLGSSSQMKFNMQLSVGTKAKMEIGKRMCNTGRQTYKHYWQQFIIVGIFYNHSFMSSAPADIRYSGQQQALQPRLDYLGFSIGFERQHQHIIHHINLDF